MYYQYEPIGDENIFQEFCKDFFNCLLETDSFQIYKTKGSPQFGIDVISINLQIVIQSKKKKRLRSDKDIELELINELESSLKETTKLPFTFKKFILASTTKKYSKVQDLALQLSQKLKREIEFWSWEDIQLHINRFEKIRELYYPHLKNNDKLYPKILNYLPKINKEDIIGRASELQKLHDLLIYSEKIVHISGIGGIGKSTLAKYFVNRFINTYDHILWLDITSKEEEVESNSFEESLSQNTVLARNLGIELNTDTTSAERCKLILNKIQNLSGKNLLVVDNANQDIYEYYKQLPSKSWNVLLTSREKLDECAELEIEVLNDYDSKKLFYYYYDAEREDKLIDSILSFIGNHTLSIELLSKTAKKRHLSLKELTKLLEYDGLKLSKSAKVISNHDPHKNPLRPFDYLLSIFSISLLNANQHNYLRYLSILPSEFISYNDLKDLCDVQDDDNTFFDDVSELVEKGWLKSFDDSFNLHQVIGEILREKLSPNILNCKELFSRIKDKLTLDWGENPLKVAPFVRYGENIAKYIDSEGDDFADFYILLGMREEDLSNFKKALFYFHKSEFIYNRDKENNQDNLAKCYNNLQSVYKTLGDLDKAFHYQLEDISIKEKFLHPLHPDFGTSYNNLSLLYKIKGDSKKALEYQRRALIIAEQTLPKDHPHLASAYNNYSILLDYFYKHKDALIYQLKALEIREKSLEEDHPQLAESYGNLASIYIALGELKKAQKLLTKSIKIRERIFSDKHHSLGTSYNNLGSADLVEVGQ